MHNDNMAAARRERNVIGFENQISRNRLDLHTVDGGRTYSATVTVTLAGGHEIRVTGETPNEIGALPSFMLPGIKKAARKGWDAGTPSQRAEFKNNYAAFEKHVLDSFAAGKSGGMFSNVASVKKFVTKLAKNPVVDALAPVLAINANPKLTPMRDAVVRSLPGGAAAMQTALKAQASIKAMTAASHALTAAAPGLGASAPAALAAATAMKSAVALVAARAHAAAGNRGKAAALVQHAAATAKHDATLHAAQASANRVYAALIAS